MKVIRFFWPKILIFLIAAFLANNSFGEEFNSKLIKEYLAKDKFEIDTEADAIILYESRTSEISVETGISSYYYKQLEHVHKIIKIIKSSALKEANVRILYREDGIRGFIYQIEAKTYNLSGNEVKETGLKKDDIYRKQVNGNLYELGFALPGVVEGSIIDYSYDHISPLNDFIPKWEIQGDYPVLLNIFRLKYPPRFEFTAISHVYEPMKEYKSEADCLAGNEAFCHYSSSFNINDFKTNFWLRRNIPATKNEPYIHNLANYVENLYLQPTGYLTETGMKYFENSWPKVDEQLMKSELLKSITKRNSFLDDVLDSIANNCHHDTVRAIYNFVRAHFKSTDEMGIGSKKELKEVFRDHLGNSAEINALLCAMLTRAEIDASPLLLGTTGHVSPIAEFPVAERFNFLACIVQHDSGYTLLDASDKNNIYGQLPPDCYNGYARIIGKTGTGIVLSPQQLKDNSVTSIRITAMTDTGASIEIIQKLGLIRSEDLRKSWEKEEKKKKEYLDNYIREMPSGFNITKSGIDNKDNPDTNIVMTMKGTLHLDPQAGILYLNSVLIKNLTQNPFKATVRTLPVEFPYQSQYQYVLSIQLPEDMEPENLPPPAITDLENGALILKKTYGYYTGMHTVSVNSTFNVNSLNYPVGYYDEIRRFFQEMIKKDNEVLSIKKIAKK